MSAPDPMARARTQLILAHPFFGVLALRTKMRIDHNCPTAWCDGSTIGYNPKFVAGLTAAQVIGLLMHELYHKIFMHHLRRGQRNPTKWNIAADYAINLFVKDIPDIALPPTDLLDEKYRNMSAEQIYDVLPDSKCRGRCNGNCQPNPNQPPGGGGQGNTVQCTCPQTSDPGGCGEVRDPEQGSGTPEEHEARIKQEIAQAVAVAKMRGKLPAGMDIYLDELLDPKVPWVEVLRRFMTERARGDYSWSRPNRRYVGQGLYLPSLSDEGAAGEFVFGVDTSGSMYGDPLLACVSEVNAILEDVLPLRSHVVYTDAAVARVDVFERGQPLVVDPAGGGGTSFKPVFQWVEEQGMTPKCLIYMTDGFGDFPAHEPPYPVLWLMTEDVEPPFGEVIRIEV